MRLPLAPVWRAFQAWALPPACLGCGLPADPRSGLCDPCRALLGAGPPRPPPALAELGIDVHAALAYDAASAPLLARYKFHGDLAAGRALAAIALPTLAAAPRPQALVPVPLHRDRLRQRGHDQALGLARDWGHALGVPVAARLLHRQRATRPQTELHADERRRNLDGAFVATAACPRHVALVDDVLTTGSTAAAAARALRASGAARIELWVVAQVQAARAK